MPKRAKKKRCNPVKAATLLSVIFSCVRTAYLSEFSISATSFAVAVTILNPLSLILSSRVSSCRRCVDFSASLFGKKNWSIGAERVTDWVRERMVSIINTRVSNNLTTIYTSNLSPEELRGELGDRIASRVLGSSQVVEITSGDRRGL